MVVVDGSRQIHVPADRVWRHLGDDGFVRLDLAIDVAEGADATEVSMGLGMTPRRLVAPVCYLLWPLMMRAQARETMRLTLDQLKSALEEEGSQS